MVFPLIHERTQLTSPREPDHGMNVIRHDDKPDTQAIVLGQTTAQMPNDDPFRPIMLQKISTFVTRKRHKMDMFLIVVAPGRLRQNPTR